jgi:ubiquinone/menaquinone biosynthesis C-methylase UbiE
MYNFYKRFYQLKAFDGEISKNKFAFLIYDDNGNYYFKENSLLEKNEINNILDLIDDLNKNYGADVINYYPVCFYRETLILALRIENCNCGLNKRDINLVNEKYAEVINYHIITYGNLFLSNNIIKEIKMSQRYIRRYIFHEKFIKKYILTEKKRKKQEYKNLIYDLIPNAESIIDVSCGDNSDVFDVSKKKKYKTIVGNDICVNYLREVNNNNIYFTNENVEINSFKSLSFDVSYCKNTLHHMNNVTNIYNMINFMKKISNEIIIVEIENPHIYGGIPSFLNKYLYGWFLKDVGKCYLNFKQFKSIIGNCFSDEKYTLVYSNFQSILGRYMIAKIVRRK